MRKHSAFKYKSFFRIEHILLHIVLYEETMYKHVWREFPH